MQSPFEAIKVVDGEGHEWWNSRKLARLFGESGEVYFKSWEKIFEIRPKRKSSYTKYIQATLWWVKKEWLVSAEEIEYSKDPTKDLYGDDNC